MSATGPSTNTASASHEAAVYDVAVIGGGIAGASAAFSLSADHSVVLLEQEAELAFHTTSRSAAIFVEHRGGAITHPLSTASRPFLEDPPGEIDAPIFSPRGAVDVGPEAFIDRFTAEAHESQEITPSIQLVQGQDLLDLCPVLRPGRAVVGVYEPDAMSIDVMGLHQFYVREARRKGLTIERSARVGALERTNGVWNITTSAGPVRAGLVVNAAGAWGDVVGAMAGAEPIGLTPMRRTAFTTTIGHDPEPWPFVYAPLDDGDACYFKAEAGNQLLCSLADETPSEPCDARAEEIDVAKAIDNLNELTTLGIRSVNTTWAGLRTFAPDRNPVLGWDDRIEGFCWMVGQGGTGILTSFASGQAIASAIGATPLPPKLIELGITTDDLAPRRPLP